MCCDVGATSFPTKGCGILRRRYDEANVILFGKRQDVYFALLVYLGSCNNRGARNFCKLCKIWWPLPNSFFRFVRSNFFQKLDYVDAIHLVRKSKKTLNDRLPSEDGSNRPETLPKRASDDPQHSFGPKNQKCFGFWSIM